MFFITQFRKTKFYFQKKHQNYLLMSYLAIQRGELTQTLPLEGSYVIVSQVLDHSFCVDGAPCVDVIFSGQGDSI
jgi:hypothetical protein